MIVVIPLMDEGGLPLINKKGKLCLLVDGLYEPGAYNARGYSFLHHIR